MRISSGIACAALVCALALLADSSQTVPFPAGYRTWTVTRSFIAAEGPNAGFHHYYANPQALEGFTAGKFPDGAVLVDERLEVGSTWRGQLRGETHQHSRHEERQPPLFGNGRMGIRGTLGDSQVLSGPADMRATCYACHSKQKDHDFVFSTFRK